MHGTIVLTPDQLAELVVAVLQSNGLDAEQVALYSDQRDEQGNPTGGQSLVGYDRAVISFKFGELQVHSKPPESDMSSDLLHRMLYPPMNPNDSPTAFSGGNGSKPPVEAGAS